MAAAYALFNPKTVAFVVAGALTIVDASLGAAAEWAALALFVVLASLTVTAPVAFAVLAPQSSAESLVSARRWLSDNGSILTAAVLGVLGVVLVYSAANDWLTLRAVPLVGKANVCSVSSSSIVPIRFFCRCRSEMQSTACQCAGARRVAKRSNCGLLGGPPFANSSWPSARRSRHWPAKRVASSRCRAVWARASYSRAPLLSGANVMIVCPWLGASARATDL